MRVGGLEGMLAYVLVGGLEDCQRACYRARSEAC